MRSRAEGFGPESIRRIMLGTYALSAGYYDAYYGQAQKARTIIIRDFERAFADYDVLLTPTSPTTAFKIGEKAADPLAMYLSDYFTIPVNLAGNTAVSIPVGLGKDTGLPVGLQLIGNPLRRVDDLAGSRRARASGRVRHHADGGGGAGVVEPLAAVLRSAASSYRMISVILRCLMAPRAA